MVQPPDLLDTATITNFNILTAAAVQNFPELTLPKNDFIVYIVELTP